MRLPLALAVTALLAFVAACAGGTGATGPRPAPPTALRATEPLNVPRAAHAAALLPSGRVLIVGGCTLPGCDDVEGQTDTAEVYDPQTGRFTPTGRTSRIRISAEAEPLPDGRVLVAGGYSGTRPTAAAEVYNETTATFEEVEPMLTPRADGTATRLHDGKILFAGGDDGTTVLATAELYDPATGQFTPTGSMTAPRKVHAATLLADGRVLLTGGTKTREDDVIRTAEVYDPKTGTFKRTGPLAQIRYKHGSALLGDGRVLVVGGAPAFDLGLRYRETEIWNSRTGRFTPGPKLATGRYHLRDAVVSLPKGRVLVAGDGKQLELYDPRRKRFDRVGRIGVELGFSTAVRLRDGSVLVAGGYSSLGEKPVRHAWRFRTG
jgi:hypothetical protein